MITQWNAALYERRAKRAIIIALRMIAAMIEAEAKRLCTELEAVDTGRLRASITYVIDEGKLTAMVGSNVLYAIYVELGTIKMTARPYLRGALEAVRPKIPGVLQQAWRLAA